MCKEDVRLGRAKEATGTGLTAVPSAAAVQMLPANPNRSGLFVWFAPDTITADSAVRVLAGGGSGPTVALLTVYQPAAYLSVEQYGDGITRAIWMLASTADGGSVGATEVRWNEELGKL